MIKIKLLVLDENQEFSSSMADFARDIPELDFLGVKTRIDTLREEHEADAPKIIFVSSDLINFYGEDLLATVKQKWPEAWCYQLTVFKDPMYNEYAIRRGFDGSVPRSEVERHIQEIINQIKDSGGETED